MKYKIILGILTIVFIGLVTSYFYIDTDVEMNFQNKEIELLKNPVLDCNIVKIEMGDKSEQSTFVGGRILNYSAGQQYTMSTYEYFDCPNKNEIHGCRIRWGEEKNIIDDFEFEIIPYGGPSSLEHVMFDISSNIQAVYYIESNLDIVRNITVTEERCDVIESDYSCDRCIIYEGGKYKRIKDV